MRHEICGLDPSAATACSISSKDVMLRKGTAPSSQSGADSEIFVIDQWLLITSRLTAREYTPSFERVKVSGRPERVELEVGEVMGGGGR